MTNPPYMLEHLPAICELLRHPRCYAFLHVTRARGRGRVRFSGRARVRVWVRVRVRIRV